MGSTGSTAQPSVGIVVVLHQQRPAESQALLSLNEVSPGVRDRFFIDVYDNSGTPSEFSPIEHVDSFSSDGGNPGLADRYNAAAEHMEHEGIAWLMLLDQDTTVTRAYLDEVLAWIERDDELRSKNVDVVVPSLMAGRRQISPHARVRIRTRPLSEHGIYRADEPCYFFNSGAVLRLAAVQAVGGFPTDYPLDYLDHAMSSRLRRHGSSTLLLVAELQHHFSLMHRGSLTLARQASIQRSEERYFAEFGSRVDRLFLLTRRLALLGLIGLRLRKTPSVGAEVQGVARAAALVFPSAKGSEAKP